MTLIKNPIVANSKSYNIIVSMIVESVQARYHESITTEGGDILSILSENKSRVIHKGHVGSVVSVDDALTVIEGSADNVVARHLGEAVIFGTVGEAFAEKHARILIVGDLGKAIVGKDGEIRATGEIGETEYRDGEGQGTVKPNYELSEETRNLLRKFLL